MCQNIKQKENTWLNAMGDLMWNYPLVKIWLNINSRLPLIKNELIYLKLVKM